MKEGWELHTLGDVATFINGDRSTNYPSKKDYVVDGIPFVNAGNLIQTGLDIASLNFISQDKYDSLTQGRFVEGDILFCLRGTLGKHSIVQNGLKGAVASSLVIIRTKDGFCNKYISYYLDYKQPFIERLNNGAAQPNIPAKTMKGFSIQFPPNEKQQQSIVEYLDSAFAKIDAMKTNAEKALNEAKALFQASLKEMLEPKEGWTYKKLGELASFARGLTYSKNDEVEHSNNIVLRSNNIDLIAGKLDFSELKYLKEDFVIPDDKRLRKGSLFICMSNGSKAHLGKVAYVDKDYSYAFGGFMGQISPNNEINGLYLHYALSSPFYKEYIKSLSEGANINNLKFKDLSEFPIKYPPLSEQQSIVETLDSLKSKVDKLQENYNKISQECDALKQAILRKVFE